MGNHWTQEDEDNFERNRIDANRARVNRKGTNVTEETKAKKKRETKTIAQQMADLKARGEKQLEKMKATRAKMAEGLATVDAEIAKLASDLGKDDGLSEKSLLCSSEIPEARLPRTNKL